MKKIVVLKPTKRAFGNEYPVRYYKNGKLVHSTVMFGNDIRYADRAYTKEFQGVTITRSYLKKKKK